MIKWPSNWKLSRIDLAILLFLGCMLLAFGASANPDVTQVSLTIDNPGLVPGSPYNQYHVSFHVNSGLTTANGFFITFDQNTTVDDPLDPQCVNVTYNNTTLHPSWVIVIDNPDPGYAQYGFPDGTTTVKMDCPMAIPFNDDVTIDFDCGIFNDCPCICSGYYVWANTDVEKNPVKSNADNLQVEVNATAGPNGSISPSGVTAYNCCDEPMYTITPASSCYYISDVTVDNISVYNDLYFNPDGSADYYFDPLVCSHDIHATFAMEVFEVTASAGVGGTIRSPDGTLSPPDHIQQFDCGDTPCYFIKPGLSNRILDVTVDTISVVGEPGYTEYANGSALYCFDPLDADHLINATFELAPVDVFLKWRVPEEDCGYIEEVQVFGSDEIIPSVEFANALYVGGNTSEFNLLGYTSGHFFSGFDGTWTPGTAVGDQINLTGITHIEDETFTITVNLNDGSQQVFTQTISSSSDIPIVADGVKVVSVVGSGSGSTPGYQNKFDITGNPSGTDFGDFGYTASQVFTQGDSLGEALELDMVNPPAVNPETYIVVYTGDDASAGNMAALVILDDGTEIWAPYAPSNVVNITNMYVPSFTWNLYTEDWLDAHPQFEGLIGVKIYVNDGTYPETFEIDTPGVDMVSVNGADYTIIDAYGITPVGSGSTTAAVLISAGCVNFEGFTVMDAGSDVGGSPDEDGNGYIDASGIVVYPSSWKCNATYIDEQAYPCAVGRVNVLNNTVFGSQAIGIKAIDACVLISENEVFDNAWDGILVNGVRRGVECIDPPAITGGINASSEITGNEIYGNGDFSTDRWVLNGQFTNIAVGNDYVDSGIEVESLDDDGDTLYIKYNDVYENADAGLTLLEDATIGHLEIVANAFYDNGVFGITTWASVPERITCMWNDIYGNTFWGIKNWDNDTLVAKENYWGEPGGPSEGPEPIIHQEDQRSDALGNGDAVSHRIHYNPWLYLTAYEIFHDTSSPIRSYGSDTLLLQSGWNTLSVPCSLDQDANTIAEIATLGYYLDNNNTEVVYQWDPVSLMWIDIGSSPVEIIPCRGYYIKMTQSSRFPVLYSSNPSPGLPTYAVVEGWNLIGAPWGIDRTDDSTQYDQGRWGVASPDLDDDDAFKPVFEALESIKEGSGGTKGVAVVISPSVPGQYTIWSAAVTDGFWDPIYNDDEMVTGDGYWVYMVNPSTYAGFEITPFYFL